MRTARVEAIDCREPVAIGIQATHRGRVQHHPHGVKALPRLTRRLSGGRITDSMICAASSSSDEAARIVCK